MLVCIYISIYGLIILILDGVFFGLRVLIQVWFLGGGLGRTGGGRGGGGVKGGLEGVNSCADFGGFLTNGIGGQVAAGEGVAAVLEQLFGEVEGGRRASEVIHGGVVSACGGDGCGVRTKPNP